MKTIYFVLVFFLVSTCLYSTIINVPADQPTIQAGINASVVADTVLVQPGTYFENINYYGKLITIASLFLTTQDTTYISQTIINGSQPVNPDFGSVVVFESGEDSTTVLCGVTLTGGSGNLDPLLMLTEGGGIYCTSSSPSLINIIISGNTVSLGNGGGILCNYNSSPSLENVKIIGNTAQYSSWYIAGGDGGGICCYDNSNPSLQNVTITDNSASNGGGIYCSGSSPILINVVLSENSVDGVDYNTGFGGGFYCFESSPSLVNVTVTGNFATGFYGVGGGIYCDYSSPNLENVTITGNSADYMGGGISCYYSNPSLLNVIISGNSSHMGGGISCYGYSNPSLLNVSIISNSAGSGGGFYCTYNSNPNLTNVTITGNSADYTGDGIYCRHNSNPSLLNSILWNNLPIDIYFSENLDPNSVTISNSDIQGGEAGIVTNNNGTVNWLEGNIDEDPLFVATGDHPFMLLDQSPCVNTGIPDTTGLNLPEFDLAGNLRVFGGRIDMGAYENQNVVVDADENLIPLVTKLNQNYPNPFNPSTTINYSLKENSKISLNIYNIKGQKVKQLVNDQLPTGQHSVVWDGKDDNGKSVSSGIFFYKLKTSNFERTRKMILMK